jgi:hypothetical protein
VYAELKEGGERVAAKRIGRLMREEALRTSLSGATALRLKPADRSLDRELSRRSDQLEQPDVLDVEVVAGAA